MIKPVDRTNPDVWRRLYAEGKNDLRYPNDVLVRLGSRLFSKKHDRRLLDFGFGTGANLLHFASQGFEIHGVEISEHALARARERLLAASLSCDLHLIEVGQRLPFPDGFFDVVYAWQMLYYNNRDGWMSTVGELERVTRKDGLVIIATAAPGDISQVEAEPLAITCIAPKLRTKKDVFSRFRTGRRLLIFFPAGRLKLASLASGLEVPPHVTGLSPIG